MTEILEKDRLLIRRLTVLILENLENEHFNVNELVHQSGLTHYILIHRIQAATGKTINQFIRETRLLKALEILQKEDLTASEVAYKTGFGSATYFNTCFTEYFGYPPGAVKKGEIKINVKLPDTIDGTDKVINRDILRTMIFTAVGVSMILILIYLGKILIFNNTVLGSGKYSAGSEKSIAVLPFKNIGNNIEDMYFIDGITNEIELRLSGLNDLRVVSGPSLEQFRGSPDPPSMIARKLKVNYILNGSGQKYGNAFRLRVQLIEAATNRQIWADKYDEKILETNDIIGIQSIVAKTVAEELKTKITSEEKDRIEKTPTLSLDAYDFYQRGREEADKLGTYEFNPEIIGRAEDFYRKAISHDETFAQAYLGLAGLLWKRWYLDYSVLNEDNPDYYMDSMFLLANTALKFDKKNEEAYIIRGSYYSVNGSPEQAIDEYDKALKFNPNFAPAYFMKGGLLEEIDIVGSLENFYKASTLSHGTEMVTALTRIAYNFYNSGFPEKGDYYMKEASLLESDSVPYCYKTYKILADTRGEYAAAADYAGKRLKNEPGNIILLRDLGYYHCLAGNYTESLKYYKQYVDLYNTGMRPSPFLNRFTYLGFVFRQNGLIKDADYYFEKQVHVYSDRLKSILPTEQIYWTYPLAGIYAAMGNKEKAINYLKMFSQNKSYTLSWVTLINNDPLLNSIRNDPEFQEIVKDVETKYIAQHEKVGKWLEEARLK